MLKTTRAFPLLWRALLSLPLLAACSASPDSEPASTSAEALSIGPCQTCGHPIDLCGEPNDAPCCGDPGQVACSSGETGCYGWYQSNAGAGATSPGTCEPCGGPGGGAGSPPELLCNPPHSAETGCAPGYVADLFYCVPCGGAQERACAGKPACGENLGNVNGTCTPRTTLTEEEWIKGTAGQWVGDDWSAGDFNGDGLTDLAIAWNAGGAVDIDVYLSTGTTFVQERWASSQGAFPNNASFVVADFNGDGRADIGDAFDDNGNIDIAVYLSTGTGFTLQTWATGQGSYGTGVFVGGDFNADGYGDVAYAFDDGGNVSVDVHLSRGSVAAGGFVLQRWATAQGEWISDPNAGWYAGDYTGDGKADLAYRFPDTDGNVGCYWNFAMGPCFSFDVYASTGSTFTGSRWFTQMGACQGSDCSAITVQDINGDGRMDLASTNASMTPSNNSGNGTSYADFDDTSVFFSTAASGSAIGASFDYQDQYPVNLNPDQLYLWGGDFRGGDFNGDGLGDFCQMFSGPSGTSSGTPIYIFCYL